MMRIVLTGLLLLVFLSVKAQPCNCSAALQNLKQYTEKNYAGFHDKVSSFGKAAYQKHSSALQFSATKINSRLHCINLMEDWLSFFKDGHLYLSFSPDSSYYVSAPKQFINLSEAQLSRLQSVNDPAVIEGIYYSADSVYTVAVIKQSSQQRDFAAVILSSKIPGWKKGDLKFELKKQTSGLYRVTWYGHTNIPQTDRLSFETANALLLNGWKKKTSLPVVSKTVSVKREAVLFEEENKQVMFYKKLNDSTNYVRIKSFGVQHLAGIEKMLTDHMPALTSLPNLVIDIRNNNGGGDISYRLLASLLYTDPVMMTGVDFFATDDNIKAFTNDIKAAGLPAADEKEYLDEMKRAAKFSGRLYNMFADYTDSSGVAMPYPSNVSIVINEKCASSAEQFLLAALQSKKVMLYGQPTRGVLDYANVCNYFFSRDDFYLHYPTSRSRRIDTGKGIENKGVQPTVLLDLTDRLWLETIVQDFTNHSIQ